jgi:hypothetical protein
MRILIVGGAISLALAGAAVWLPAGKFTSYRPFSNAFARAQVAVDTHGAGAQQQADPQSDQDIVPSIVVREAPERHRVIRGAIANLKKHYVDPAIANITAESVLAHERAGEYASGDDLFFAGLVTKHMRVASQDLHLELIYSRAVLPSLSAGPPSAEAAARYRAAMEQNDCTFERVEILPHRIGLLKLNSFPNPSACGPKAASAMAAMNGANTIIFDLRDNRGGSPEMVMFLAAYLFDRPEYMYNPRENTSKRLWTASPVSGSKLADKPVYILTSATTASAAEHFSYDLKMLKRATLVGETTAGVAHSGVLHRIDDHFAIAITESKPINPFSRADWAVTGVEPDVKVKAADALAEAQRLTTR